MKISNTTNRLSSILKFCLGSIICISYICCSEKNAETVVLDPYTEQDNIARYDSTYNASYNLYIVSDDTTAYNPQLYYTHLSSEEKNIGSILNEYAMKMLTDYSGSVDENTILSPISAAMLYSLMANFTDDKKSGNTFKESMGIGQAKNKDINSFFRKYINKKNASANNERDKRGISFASNLWMEKKSAVYNSFLSTSKFYGFGVKGMDMQNNTSIEEINQVVNGQMGNSGVIIKQSALQSAKPLVTSSMSFKGEWEEKFRLDSAQTNIFTNANGTKTISKQLHITRKGKYADFGAFEMIEIPYKGNEYSMYIVLPHLEDGLTNSLVALKNQGIVNSMDFVSDTTRTFHGEYLVPRDTTTAYGTFNVVDTLIADTLIDIRIPKFRLQASTGLNPQNIGASSATKLMYQTNLPKVSPNGYKLSNVFQVCNFEVNEESASASSGGTIVALNEVDQNYYITTVTIVNASDVASAPRGRKIKNTVVLPFHVIHPFAVFIRENEIGSIPFACIIKNLTN